MLPELPAQLAVLLHMGEGVLVCIATVLQQVTSLTACIQFPNPDIPVYRGEGCLSIKGHTETGLLWHSPLSSAPIRYLTGKPQLVWDLDFAEDMICHGVYVAV